MNLRTVGAWITAGAAFWVSLGSLDVAVDGAQVVRLAMLPSGAQLAACLALALIVGAVLTVRLSEAPRAVPGAAGVEPRRPRSGDSFLPLYALAALILPYLPWLPDWVPVVRVFAGPGRLLVWLIVASQVAWSVLGTGRGPRLVVRMRAWSALRSYVVVFAASALLFGTAALAIAPSGMFPGGDEPHYLIITQSLLTDRDLRIENNHARQDYAAYYDSDLEPHAIAPGRDGGTYSVHPVGLPLLAAPAFALGGYPAVVLLMIVLAAAAAALAWRWVRRVTGSVAAATFSWSVTALSVPYLTNSGTVYPEIPAAFAVLAAATVAIRDVGLGDAGAAAPAPARAWRALLLGLATAVLPWLHAKYSLMAAVLLAIGVWRVWRDRPPSPWTRERLVLTAAAPFALSIAAWLAFHYVIWGSPWPSAPYGGAAGTQMSAGALVRGVPGLLFDQEYGILPYAPALALGFVGLWSMWRTGGRARGLAVEIGLALGALIGTVGAFHMWWGGTALPGRMLISGLLLLTLPVAWEFREGADRPERRAAYRLLLLVGLATSLAVLVVRNGATLALGRNGISRFLEWLSPDWYLWAFAPDFIMQPAWLALAQAGIWLLVIAASAWTVGLLAARGTAARGSSRTGRGLAFLRADAGALLTVVLATGVMPLALGAYLKPCPSPEDRSRIQMLDSFDPHARPIGIRFDPLSFVDAQSLPQAFSVSARPGSRTARQPAPVLLNARFALPSGRYACEIEPRSGAGSPSGLSGSLVLQAGRSGGALTEWNVDVPAGRRWQGTFDLPVDVNFVGFRAAPGLESEVGELRLSPVRVVPVLERIVAHDVLASLALDRFVFLFHDGASYPEPNGFWVRGSSRALVSVVSQSGRLTTGVRLRIRSPIANTVRFELPGLTRTVELEAGVPTDLDLEPAAIDGVLRMTINPESGFRPAETQPGNRDRRFLGCWVEVVG